MFTKWFTNQYKENSHNKFTIKELKSGYSYCWYVERTCAISGTADLAFK